VVMSAHVAMQRDVVIPVDSGAMLGTLGVPSRTRGLVIFAHGSGSGRQSPRNQFVANELQSAGLATLLIDLLTADEETIDRRSGHLRFDIGLLAARLMRAKDAAASWSETGQMRVGYFGASTGAAAAIVAAAQTPGQIRAIVSRGGRPDLARDALRRVDASTLLIVGGADPVVLDLNREAMQMMRVQAQLVVIPGATHLFEEPGALEEVARLARAWFLRYLE
jgi:putative phosphoribosyl transferase